MSIEYTPRSDIPPLYSPLVGASHAHQRTVLQPRGDQPLDPRLVLNVTRVELQCGGDGETDPFVARLDVLTVLLRAHETDDGIAVATLHGDIAHRRPWHHDRHLIA